MAAVPSIEPLLDQVRDVVRRDAPHLERLLEIFAQEARGGREWLTPSLNRLAPGAVILEVGAGLMLASGKLPRLSATLLAGSLVLTTAAGHRFWEEQDEKARAQQTIHFLKNASMLGGLILAAEKPVKRPFNAKLALALAIPDSTVDTKKARDLLPDHLVQPIHSHLPVPARPLATEAVTVVSDAAVIRVGGPPRAQELPVDRLGIVGVAAFLADQQAL